MRSRLDTVCATKAVATLQPRLKRCWDCWLQDVFAQRTLHWSPAEGGGEEVQCWAHNGQICQCPCSNSAPVFSSQLPSTPSCKRCLKTAIAPDLLTSIDHNVIQCLIMTGSLVRCCWSLCSSLSLQSSIAPSCCGGWAETTNNTLVVPFVFALLCFAESSFEACDCSSRKLPFKVTAFNKEVAFRNQIDTC